MVFPKALPFTRFAFSKGVTHGYAQSVVAASQSSYASQNNPLQSIGNRFQKPHGHGHNAAALNSAQAKQAKDASSLFEYLKEWHIRKQAAKDWEQFQFAKRIEWHPLALAAEAEEAGADVKATEAEESVSVGREEHVESEAISTEGVEDPALAQLDKALAEVSRQQQEVEQQEQHAVEKEVVSPFTVEVAEASPESLAYTRQLEKLAASKHYAEIPAVFEAMLNAGIKPTATAYNVLLLAAIRLPKSKHAVILKAMDVYSDMLNRRVLPDMKTYTILIELLSTRALSVLTMQNALEEKRSRYGGLDEEGKFLFRSDEEEAKILAEDDSISVAVRLFEAATSIHTLDSFSERTYRLLVSACAEHGALQDMVRIYTSMEKHSIVPRADMFVPMIHAFATAGDIDNSVACYDEYKALAIANEAGQIDMVRRDNDVYAAVVKAFAIVDNEHGATKFMTKLEAVSASEESTAALRDAVGLKGYVTEYVKQGKFQTALNHAKEKLSAPARDVAFSAISIRAADRGNVEIATEAFGLLSEEADLSGPALALSAMHVRTGDMDAAEEYWRTVESSNVNKQSIDATTMHAIALVATGNADVGIQRARNMFARVREVSGSHADILEQIDEAILVIGHYVGSRGIVMPPTSSMELISAMIENQGIIPSVANHLVAGFGPEDITRLGPVELQLLMQAQGSLISIGSTADIAHAARFSHVLELLITSGVESSASTVDAIERSLQKLERPDLTQRWQTRGYVASDVYTPAQFSPYPQTPITPAQPAVEDSYDPYAATTDNKGSVVITDLLEKNGGKFSNHLNEALTRFKNMRRAGRHPRFFTYAKLISAAAKENKLPLAHEILALARQDVPFQPQYRIVRYGWVTILDSMVAACLTTGQRHLADQFHQELLSMGAAPTANTFGLYITTLKESTKTFDEASEAVRIFHQAKSEGVEPSSFLYNALIGKLGKARRIDDCLFYFQEMRNLGIRPTSVTYGTIVNALCRVSDEKFAEELFEEMESMPNYKPRPAPYHSMMQFFLSTKRDRAKVLSYYDRMRARGIQPTPHTFKLLIDTHATLEPLDMPAAEAVLSQIRQAGSHPEAVHYSSLIHAKGCVANDIAGARALFDSVLAEGAVRPQPCLYQALFESMVANHDVQATEPVLADMARRGVELTAYIANALVHGWALAGDVAKAEAVYARVAREKREPSTYEAMTRAYMVAGLRDRAMGVVNEAMARGYPGAVAGKILDLVGGGRQAVYTPPLSASVESMASGL